MLFPVPSGLSHALVRFMKRNLLHALAHAWLFPALMLHLYPTTIKGTVLERRKAEDALRER